MAAASGPALVYAWRLSSDSYPCEPPRKGLRRHRVILAIQSFLAVVLAMGALAPHAVVGRAMHEPLGFDPRQVAFFRIGGRVSVRDDVGKAALVQALLAQLRDTPAVEAGNDFADAPRTGRRNDGVARARQRRKEDGQAALP